MDDKLPPMNIAGATIDPESPMDEAEWAGLLEVDREMNDVTWFERQAEPKVIIEDLSAFVEEVRDLSKKMMAFRDYEEKAPHIERRLANLERAAQDLNERLKKLEENP